MWIWLLVVGVLLLLFFIYHTVRTKRELTENDAIHYVCNQCGEKDCICHPEDRDVAGE